jgi:hypothetical protein
MNFRRPALSSLLAPGGCFAFFRRTDGRHLHQVFPQAGTVGQRIICDITDTM